MIKHTWLLGLAGAWYLAESLLKGQRGRNLCAFVELKGSLCWKNCFKQQSQKRPSACINQYLFIKGSGVMQSYSGRVNVPVQSHRESAAQSQAAASAGSAGTDVPRQLATDGNNDDMSCRRCLKIDPNKVVCGFSTFESPSYSGG